MPIVIPDSELTVTFVRTSGPGGQNMNKVSTAVELRFDIGRSPSLPDDVRECLIALAGNRATRDGILIITAHEHLRRRRIEPKRVSEKLPDRSDAAGSPSEYSVVAITISHSCVFDETFVS